MSLVTNDDLVCSSLPDPFVDAAVERSLDSLGGVGVIEDVWMRRIVEVSSILA
jgi:hypothetical protein